MFPLLDNPIIMILKYTQHGVYCHPKDNVTQIVCLLKPVADPGFPVGGAPGRWGGGADLRQWMRKQKNWIVFVGALAAPLDPPMKAEYCIYLRENIRFVE